MHRFKDLEIWKRVRLLCSQIYSITSSFPASEKFGLTNQLRRASVSIPSNIAEGCARNSNKEFKRYLEFAIGSMYELETQLLISGDINYLQTKDLEPLLKSLDAMIKMTSKFKSSLK